MSDYNNSSKQTQTKQLPLVIIRDSSRTNTDLSIFPPSRHENLHYCPQPESPPSSSSSPVSPLDFDSWDPPDSPEPCDSREERAEKKVSGWFDFGLRVLRSKFLGIFRCGEGVRRVNWSFGSLLMSAGFAVVVVIWWSRRRRRRRLDSVERLRMIVEEKNEKIMQLLFQIAKMNELLLEHHRVSIPKLQE